MKILVIGFGSIGQRHYKNLRALGFDDVYVYDVDGRKISDKDLKTIRDIRVETLTKFDVAFVCNPNNFHVTTAIKCAEAGCHLFIEKPLSHNLRGVQRLEHICQKRKLINMVACNMRFNLCLQFIKNYVVKNKLGDIYGIHHEFGYYLPYWRAKQNYKKNYAVKKKTGGGIILDDIHEFDLLFWFNDFANVKTQSFIFGKTSKLDIETEDNCIASFKFANNVLGSVRCDYIQRHYSRNCKVVGEKGNLEWDFNENVVWLRMNKENKKLFTVDNGGTNDMYVDEIRYFLNCVKQKKSTFNDIKTSLKVLKYCVERR